jgi:hypothetical protein
MIRRNDATKLVSNRADRHLIGAGRDAGRDVTVGSRRHARCTASISHRPVTKPSFRAPDGHAAINGGPVRFTSSCGAYPYVAGNARH